MKRLIKLVLLAVIILCFSVLSGFSDNINVGDGFYVYGEQTDKVCEILKMEKSDLEKYLKDNKIEYFAVDEENKKQIKLLCNETDFSNSVINISSMTSDNISALIPQIVGLENAKGDVITKGTQKFIKTAVSTKDSGGEFILTSYITVADRKNYFLNFYTMKGEDGEYIEEIFDNYAKSEVFTNEETPNFNLQKILIFIGVALFTAIFIFVGITVVKDLKKGKEETE